MTVLVVDGANVVGARPDGWWRDRAGAAQRLHDQLRSADLGNVVLVLEGQARPGAPEGLRGQVRVVHAAGSGDDAVVEIVATTTGTGVTVVTGDRELRRRVTDVGADVVGPQWLLDRLHRT